MTNDGKFKGILQSAKLNGEAIITVSEEALFFDGPGKTLPVPYADIDAFVVQNYRLLIHTESGQLVFSQMGSDVNALYENLWNAYNERTLKAFFTQGTPMFETEGEYRFSDDGGQSQGVAKIKLFGNCLCLLPPGAEARRIPLCFMSEPVMENFAIRMTLDTGETYEVIRLGNHTQRLFELLKSNMAKIHDDAMGAVKSIDGSLTAGQTSDIAWLMPDGAAAALSALQGIAPSFVNACEMRIAQSRAADTYLFFKELCAPDSLYAGIKTGLSRDEEGDAIWVSALRERDGGGIAAVELALGEESAAATYIYRFHGGKDAFFKRLNHALEAVSFHREVISLTDEELNKADKALYRMAVKRTGALRFLRNCFAGRAIHRTLEAWKSSVIEWMS